MTRFKRTARLPLVALSILALGACTDDVTAPPATVAGSFTVDATTGWTYISLADSATVTPTPSANESGAWDIAFFATNVTLNGGAAGPGGITAACLCQNATASNSELLAMTADSEKGDFDLVTSVPAGVQFTSDVLTPAISGWYAGTGAAATADPAKTFLVRLSDGLSFAKVHVTALQSPTASSAGRVTLEYAVQPTATAAFAAIKTIVVDLTAPGAKSVDLNTGALTTSATDWDLRLEGFTIKINGGVSGGGSAGAAVATQSFAATTTANVAVQSYKTDVYTGVFGAKPFYRYNISGDNRITPTFDVYLIKRGSSVYALQILNYYNSTGQARHITFRYKQIA
jgi:hypothetical protein